MSGIDELKKKAKMSLDDMYDNQPIENIDAHKATAARNQPAEKATSSLATQQHTADSKTTPPGQGQIEINQNSHKEENELGVFPVKKKHAKSPSYKMTFNLPEDIHKAFNKLYATRLIEERGSEKSEMICEAIQWLLKMEEKNRLDS